MSNGIFERNRKLQYTRRVPWVKGSLKVGDHPVVNMVCLKTDRAILHLRIIRQRRRVKIVIIFQHIYHCSLRLRQITVLVQFSEENSTTYTEITD